MITFNEMELYIKDRVEQLLKIRPQTEEVNARLLEVQTLEAFIADKMSETFKKSSD